MRPTSLSALTLSMFLAVGLSAQASPWESSMPGYIPMGSDHIQASDLVYKGRILTPEQATQLLKSGVDISKIEPQESSDYWSNKVGQKLDPQSYTLGLPASAQISYLEDVPSPTTDYRFVANFTDSQGVPKIFNVVMSKFAHNRLLRKALLEKLGYKIPALQYMSHLKVKFDGPFSRDQFLKNLQSNSGGAPDRWVTNSKDKKTDVLDLQDVIVYSGNYATMNLSDGFMLEQYIFGRRIMNALLIPWNLSDIPETVNQFNWESAKIIAGGAYVPYLYASAFSPSYQDGQWITRRIAQLKRADFEEIVAAMHVPYQVGLAITERLISRCDTMERAFGLKDVKPLSFNSKVSSAPGLVDGKVIQKSWKGYASNFAYGDNPSPISTEEIEGFIESRAFSTAINSLVGDFNTGLLNKSVNNNLQNYIGNRNFVLELNQLVETVLSGKTASIPFKPYQYPMMTGNLILSREVVFGSYMGSDNTIQLADTFGFQLNPGLFIGFDGLPTKLAVQGQVGFQISRTYTHITPIQSMAAANKTPWHNILVPFYQYTTAQSLNASSNVQCKDVLDNGGKPMTDKILCMAQNFKDQLKTGESILISDSLVLGAGLTAAYPIYSALVAQGSISDSVTTLRRVQLLKKDDNTIDVYTDPGVFNTASASIGLGVGTILAAAPILTISFNGTVGRVYTHFNALDITSTVNKDTGKYDNPDLEVNLRSIYNFLKSNQIENFQAQKKPYIFTHNFTESDQNLNFLVWSATHQKINDNIIAQTPEGFKQAYLYRTTGTRTGTDYQDFISSLLQSAIANYTKAGTTVAIDATGNGNPADTLYGSAEVREVDLQAEQTTASNQSALKEKFVQVSRRFGGFSIARDKADAILKQFNDRFGESITWPTFLNDTTEIQLYMITLSVNVYDAGIEHLAHLTREQIGDYSLSVLRANGYNTQSEAGLKAGAGFAGGVMFDFTNAQKAFLQAKATGNGPAEADAALKLVDYAEYYLPGKLLIHYVGGLNNIFIQARVQGFRKGDEDSTEDLTTSLNSNTIGMPGSKDGSGPLESLVSNLGLSEGEFFIRWIFNPL